MDRDEVMYLNVMEKQVISQLYVSNVPRDLLPLFSVGLCYTAICINVTFSGANYQNRIEYNYIIVLFLKKKIVSSKFVGFWAQSWALIVTIEK